MNYQFEVPDSLSFIWQFKDIFADENYKFNCNTSSPVVFDCGANIGLSCLYFKKLYPDSKITTIEANPDVAAILKKNLNRNNIDDVIVISKAAWINNEGIDIVLNNADSTSVYSEGKSTRIESLRLKDLLEQENSIDMLKIDIEGAEIDVIRDCRDSLDNIKNIFIEYHSYLNRKQELDEILQILKENNFRYFIKPAADRIHPFINRINKNIPEVDLQLNIYGYKEGIDR